MKNYSATIALASCLSIAYSTATYASSTPAYPAQNIEIVVAYPAGGAIDILARLIGAELQKRLDKPVIVINKAGASGVIGTNMVAKAKPDGYTLLMSGANAIISPIVDPNVTFKISDFSPIARVSETAFILSLNKDLPAKTVGELIAYSKDNPDTLNYASTGVGSVQHILGEYFQQKFGFRWLHVPYPGGSPALNDVVAGHTHIMFANPMLVLPYDKAQQLNNVAITTQERSAALPNIATMKEQNVDDLSILTWVGLLAPRDTPEPIRQMLSDHVMEILKSPDIAEKILGQGSILSPMPMAQYGQFLKADNLRWERIIEESKFADTKDN